MRNAVSCIKIKKKYARQCDYQKDNTFQIVRKSDSFDQLKKDKKLTVSVPKILLEMSMR